MTEEQRRRIDAGLREGRAVTGGERPTMEQVRAGFAAVKEALPVPEGIATETTTIGGRPALDIRPANGVSGSGVILYAHGGSFVAGSPRTALGPTAHLVLGTGTMALSLDYRLAPEHPFPAAIEDGVRAYRELLDSGTDPAAIALAGDSAGASVMIAVVLEARDAGLPLPSCVVTFSGGFDYTFSGSSFTSKQAADPIVSLDGMRATGALYRGDHDVRDPRISPAVSADLTGLPPLLLQVGGNEVLRDASVLLATRAIEADVEVVLDVVPDVPHVFPSFAGELDEADRALERAVLFLRQHLAA